MMFSSGRLVVEQAILYFPWLLNILNYLFTPVTSRPTRLSLLRPSQCFSCDVVTDDLCDTMMPSSIDVVTLIFMLSAVCPKKMHLILQNVKKVLKPDGHVLLRDYAIGDYAQVELDKRNQMISENFYIRGDGTSTFYFSEEFLSTLFGGAGFTIVDMDIYSRQIQNRSQNITMSR
ncbi:hypothetical protein RHMOL_Rhmol12G0239100 [Rhododendron molle]|uniref:Uncharacterized protein n=1 Tax=Rhododendron molle TaxID=49168 RepID=A0ACC0LMK9_RHOML|nr:hypothetical protein RHMOL_Rhmol12G0239100 [Rhododendron molle]